MRVRLESDEAAERSYLVSIHALMRVRLSEEDIDDIADLFQSTHS